MTIHANLTGADLHESKGAAGASVNTVAVADGAGSTTWKLIPKASVDGTSVKNLNLEFVSGDLLDVSTAGSSFYLPVPINLTITSIQLVLNNAITVANASVTVVNPGVGTMATITVPFTGSAPGTTITQAITASNNVVAGSYILVQSVGGSTTACRLYFTITCTMT